MNEIGWKTKGLSWLKFITGTRLAPFHPMPTPVIHSALNLAKVKRGERLYDLGCGDGRVLIYGHENFGTVGVGYEMNKELAEIAKQNVRNFFTKIYGTDKNSVNDNSCNRNPNHNQNTAQNQSEGSGSDGEREYPITIICGDALKADLANADVVTLYLSERGNKMIYEQCLKEVWKKNANLRVVSFCFEIKGIKPIHFDSVSGIPIWLFNNQSCL